MAPMRLLLLRGLAVRRSRLHFPLVGTPTHRNPKRRSAARATAFGLHRLPPPPMLIAMRTLATAAAAAATSVSFDWATTCNSADGTRGVDGRTLATGGCVRRWDLITGSGAEPRKKILAF